MPHWYSLSKPKQGKIANEYCCRNLLQYCNIVLNLYKNKKSIVDVKEKNCRGADVLSVNGNSRLLTSCRCNTSEY